MESRIQNRERIALLYEQQNTGNQLQSSTTIQRSNQQFRPAGIGEPVEEDQSTCWDDVLPPLIVFSFVSMLGTVATITLSLMR